MWLHVAPISDDSLTGENTNMEVTAEIHQKLIALAQKKTLKSCCI